MRWRNAGFVPILVGVTLAGLTFVQAQTRANGDESDVATRAVPLPIIYRGSAIAEDALFTGKADPSKIKASIAKVLDGRKGWKRTPFGWQYASFGSGSRPHYLTVSVQIYRGRAMPQKDARPQRGVWTTVEVGMDHRGVGSYAVPHDDWVLMTDKGKPETYRWDRFRVR